MSSVAIDNVNNAPESGTETPATILARPSNTHGRPIGHGTKRLGFELWTSTGAVWGPTGSTVWGPTGSAVWGGSKTWRDITDDVTGFALNQRGSGSTLAERPNPGTFTLTVDNESDVYSTWNTQVQPYVGPGAVIRVWINDPAVLDDDIGWQPLIIGVVETTSDEAAEVDAFRAVTITLVEPHSDLAKIDGYEQPGVGVGDAVVRRTSRLLAAAGYRFGSTQSSIVTTGSNSLTAAPMQSTNLSQNRLTELYLTADSADYQFISSKKGQPQLVAMPTPGNLTRTRFYTASTGPGYALPALGTGQGTLTGSDLGTGATSTDPVAVMPWSSITVDADNDAVVNRVALARVGGTVQVRQTAAPRTGQATFSRSDLILYRDGHVGTLAQLLLLRGINASLYATVEVNIFHDERLVDWLAQLDLYQKVDVLRTFERSPTTQAKQLVGIVLGYSMAITPLAAAVPLDGGPVVWTARVNLQIVAVNDYTP